MELPREAIDHEAYELAAYAGEWPAVDLDLRAPEAPPSVAEQLLAAAPKLSNPAIAAMRERLLAATSFSERYARSTIEHDLIGLLRHLPDGTVETLSHKLAREQKKGKHESAAFGLAQVGAHPSVLYAMDWDFFAGSFGVVSGEKFQLAVDLAVRRHLPLVAVYTSSGVRQHENYAGLIQMQRAVHALGRFKSRGQRPNVAVLLGQVWGGISASVVPLADVIVGVLGTEYGFSGPNVIEAYEGVAVGPGRQRVEWHAINRNVDVLVGGADEGLAFVAALLSATSPASGPKQQRRFPASMDLLIDAPADDGGLDPRLTLLDQPGVLPPTTAPRRLREVGTSETPTTLPARVHRPPTDEELYQRYDRLVRDASRPDAEHFTQQVFGEVVPLYNRFAVDGKLLYPSITASIGRLGPQPFLVIGGQASYQRTGEGLRRIPASPSPADYEHLERMLALGERCELPVVFFTDTLGAKPTLGGEEQNQMFRIANAIACSMAYPFPVLTVVIGALGSGGGLTLGPNADWFAMLDDSLAFVAEARSAASILYKTPTPSREQVMRTLSTMRATAWDQRELDLIDEVIAEAPDPFHTAANVHGALVRAYHELRGLSRSKLRQRRDTRVRNPGGLKVTRRH
jgi:acetyl-CoA carboxylase carboxyl transferase subunit beta